MIGGKTVGIHLSTGRSIRWFGHLLIEKQNDNNKSDHKITFQGGEPEIDQQLRKLLQDFVDRLNS